MIFKNVYKLRVNRNNMQKNGQVTLFVIVGLVILIISGIIFYIKFYVPDTAKEYSSDLEAVKSNIEGCVENIVRQGLSYLELHGGYALINDGFSTNGLPYYYKDNLSNIPEKNIFEEEMNKYVTANVQDCFNEVVVEDLIVESKLDIDKFNVFLDYKANFEVKGISYSLDKINIVVDTRLSQLYEAARFIIDDYVANNGWSCLSCINSFLRLNNMQLFTIYTEEGLIYSVIYDKEGLDFMVGV